MIGIRVKVTLPPYNDESSWSDDSFYFESPEVPLEGDDIELEDTSDGVRKVHHFKVIEGGHRCWRLHKHAYRGFAGLPYEENKLDRVEIWAQYSWTDEVKIEETKDKNDIYK